MGAVIGDAQLHAGIEGVPLLGCNTPPGPPHHHRHPLAGIRVGGFGTLEGPVVRRIEPGVVDLIPDRIEALVSAWIFEIRQVDEYPVCAVPLLIGMSHRPQGTVGLSRLEECLHARAGADLIVQRRGDRFA